MKPDVKGIILARLFGRWRLPSPFEEGYTIVLPSPMDMPFLLRFALEGIQHLDTTNCRQILIVPDGWGDDGGAGLKAVMKQFDDPRLQIVDLRRRDIFLTRRFKPPGGSATHWMQIVHATNHCRCEHAFLHDADAFHISRDGIERQYRETRDRGMYTLGVTARWDPFFIENGFTIPGTWELMYSTRWARSRPPLSLKGRLTKTPHGWNEFDSMLYPQYLDHESGKVGVMDSPPGFVHFSGSIFTYRLFRDRDGATVRDELFRILLLAILEDLIPAADGRRVTPQVKDLYPGITDPNAPVTYVSEVSEKSYPEFREMMEQLCDCPVFAGERADRMRALLAPFDEHWAKLAEQRGDADLKPVGAFRRSGLG
ncbi:MAG: hypothetical protein VYC34_09220 [Planctomycetota bacterium]|nr:hypothetical protein [Planctomycetota bacterium]